jgi:hypothetical protein
MLSFISRVSSYCFVILELLLGISSETHIRVYLYMLF